jgi:3D (Asp-Asp-Asp) domain-containing protein
MLERLGWLVAMAWAAAHVGTTDQQAARFDLSEPSLVEAEPLQVWSTHYVLHDATEVADGHPLLAPGDVPYPEGEPIHLTARDWCMSAMQGSARIKRLDGSVVTVTYATSEGVAVDCGPPLGNRRWRTQGRVRFSESRGPFGDGVSGFELVPYRTLATDPKVIPTGSAVYVPSARGTEVQLGGRSVVHDGWFFAADVGGAVRDLHIDTFIGTESDTALPQVTNTAAKRVDAYIVDDPEVIEELARLHR